MTIGKDVLWDVRTRSTANGERIYVEHKGYADLIDADYFKGTFRLFRMEKDGSDRWMEEFATLKDAMRRTGLCIQALWDCKDRLNIEVACRG